MPFGSDGIGDGRLILVMMGPCGCGKTTVGAALAAQLSLPFIEGDDHHPANNRAKMASGEPLSDADRWPWLDLINTELQVQIATAGSVVLACSALKRIYRDHLRRVDPQSLFVLLNGSKELLQERLDAREGHFMPASLLESQLATLEMPDRDEWALVLDVAQKPAQMIEQIMAQAMSINARG